MPFAGGAQAEDEPQRAGWQLQIWSGCGTIDGLNSAADSKENSARK